MSEAPTPLGDPELHAAATAAVEKAEAAATRRRWINLGEFVAVAGLLIAAVGLWLTWSDRQSDLADKKAEQNAQASAKSRYVVKSTMRGNDVVITPDDSHSLGDIAVTFPSTLGVSPQISATQTVQEGWFKLGLLKATDGGADDQDGRLPILLTVNYMDGDKQLATTGIFDIVWQTKGGGLLGGRSLKVLGMRMRENGGSQARLDALWKPKQ